PHQETGSLELASAAPVGASQQELLAWTPRDRCAQGDLAVRIRGGVRRRMGTTRLGQDDPVEGRRRLGGSRERRRQIQGPGSSAHVQVWAGTSAARGDWLG